MSCEHDELTSFVKAACSTSEPGAIQIDVQAKLTH